MKLGERLENIQSPIDSDHGVGYNEEGYIAAKDL
jgi:hypothetical protein